MHAWMKNLATRLRYIENMWELPNDRYKKCRVRENMAAMSCKADDAKWKFHEIGNFAAQLATIEISRKIGVELNLT